MLNISMGQRRLLRAGPLAGFAKQNLPYTCRECSKIVMMAWKKEDNNLIRVAYCDCIAWKSHINSIPKDARRWRQEVKRAYKTKTKLKRYEN